jgi:hypothetical protein
MRCDRASAGRNDECHWGVVNDPNGSVIVGAIVTVTNTATGFQRTVQTDDGGRFTFPQLRPGSYMVRVTASGFQEQRNDALPVPLGQTQTANFTLKIIEASERVEVSDRTPLINTENPNTTTTLTAKAIEDLPNPGSDLTYVAQFAPGAVMNTAGGSNDFVGGQSGYGNVQFNGLPALSNGYIVDGMETNDPLTNLNSGLSTNLVLGLNSIQEVTVNTTSYAVDQGRYGAAQINYVTKSGTNKFHGNLYEMWNGSTLNAANFSPTRRRADSNRTRMSITSAEASAAPFCTTSSSSLEILSRCESCCQSCSQ